MAPQPGYPARLLIMFVAKLPGRYVARWSQAEVLKEIRFPTKQGKWRPRFIAKVSLQVDGARDVTPRWTDRGGRRRGPEDDQVRTEPDVWHWYVSQNEDSVRKAGEGRCNSNP